MADTPSPITGPTPEMPTPPLDPRDQELPTATRILVAAIEELNARGPTGVTVRGIARRAGVNVAAISYYYRGKDALIARAIDQTLHNAFDDWLRTLADTTRPLRDRLIAIFDEMLAGTRRYPGITLAHLHAPVFEGVDDHAFARWFRRLLHALVDEVQREHPAADREAVAGAVVRLAGAHILPPLLPDTYWTVLGGSWDDAGVRRRYVEQGVDDLLAVAARSR